MAHTIVDRYFEQRISGTKVQYQCTLCRGKWMNEYSRHKKLARHKALVSVSNPEADAAPVHEEQTNSFLQIEEGMENDTSNVHDFDAFANADDDSSLPEETGYTEALMNLLTGGCSDYEDTDNDHSSEEDSDLPLDPLLQNHLEDDDTESDSSDSSDIHDVDVGEGEDASTHPKSSIDPDWYPFSKESQHTGLWHACVWQSANDWDSMYSNGIVPLNNRCYGLSVKEIIAQELANPVVTEHLVFVPEYDTNSPIDRLSQSKKWREGFSRTQRVQMVSSTSGTNYAKCLKASMRYIINSLDVEFRVDSDQPFDSPVLITIQVDDLKANFIDSRDSQGLPLNGRYGTAMLQKCDDGYHKIVIPNPWRQKANGKVIRHVPITLYSDDTSGNVSKKWNKHMSYYFTLSGLPPGMTNQQYNIHFLATSKQSKCSRACTLSKEGFTTYDESLKEEVLTMVVVLCHLGDSPMHAEITNTTNPSVTLNPCRICTLSVETLAGKQDARYTQDFVGLSDAEHGPQQRDWNVTKDRTHSLWDLLRNPKKHTEFAKKSKQYGIKDPLNVQFVKKFHELHLNKDYSNEAGFDGHMDTPVESLHVILLGVVKYLYRDAMDNLPDSSRPLVMAQWKSFDPAGLNIAPIQPTTMTNLYQSLVGKEFRTIIQTAPFVLYQHISKEKRIMWTALAHLGSFIFQPQIPDMESYLKKFKVLVNIFLGHIIRLFGPLLLCAAEHFESFNGNTRQASIHSNKQNPTLHIARAFLCSRLLRLICSGGKFWDYKLLCQARAGKEVIKLFSTNKWLQKSLGFNSSWKKDYGEAQIQMKGDKGNNVEGAPQELRNSFQKYVWTQKTTAYLKSAQWVHLKNFVLLDIGLNTLPKVGFVESFWKGHFAGKFQYLALVKNCSLSSHVDEFYGFRGLSITTEDLWIPIKKIKCVLNVQHNCHIARCEPLPSPRRHDGQLYVKSPYQIQHKEANEYIINSGALYSAEEHRFAANISYIDWTSAQWNDIIKVGQENWKTAQDKKHNMKQGRMDKAMIQRNKEIGRKRKRDDIDPSLFE
ncbi:hypothetical protein DFH28DRAFT_1229446 [Melampsora americana]|nr:hypothetical protein DFH28DRAFT_1229446 [Melampsora americana]